MRRHLSSTYALACSAALLEQALRASAVGNMSGSEAVRRAPYADDAPRELTDVDLSFLSDYTGERDLAALRQHVLRVWNDVKAKARRSGRTELVPMC